MTIPISTAGHATTTLLIEPMKHTSYLLLLLCTSAVASCTDDDGSGTGTGFPNGASAWTGTAELSGQTLELDVALTHRRGALEGRVSFDLLGQALAYDVVGVVDDESQQVALVPAGWVGESPGLTMFGVTATYDPAAGTLRGRLREGTLWDNNVLAGGAISLSTSARPSTAPDPSSATRVVDGTLTFSGTLRCQSAVRPVTLALTREPDGLLGGTMTFGEDNDTTVGTFDVVGVESATSGRLAVLPVLWDDYLAAGPPWYYSFFVDGTLDGTDYTATVYQPDGTACLEDLFQVTAE